MAYAPGYCPTGIKPLIWNIGIVTIQKPNDTTYIGGAAK